MNTMQKKPFFTKKLYTLLIAVVTVGGFIGIGYYRYSRPIPSVIITETFNTADYSKQPIAIDWPAAPNSQAAIGSVEQGVLASEPNQIRLPTASTAKLITVLTVLKEKPLALSEQGPLLTIDASDVALYNQYQAAGGSLVAVQLGEQLSQYQMLQGILIRSGNNLADSLAIWAFGSLEAYQKAAQELVGELGMASTTIGSDASGLDPNTTSTAEDLTRLGIAAMKHDVIREIVKQTSSTLPVDGTKPNTNWLLGTDGVIGIKTGNIPAVGGVFIIASEFTPANGEPITLVGAVQGEPTTAAAITISAQLAKTAQSLFVEKVVVEQGSVVATATSAWGETTEITAGKSLTTFGWKYSDVTSPLVAINKELPFEAGSSIGSISTDAQVVDAVVARTISPPSWQWRLFTNR